MADAPTNDLVSVDPEVQPSTGLTPNVPMGSPVGEAEEHTGAVLQKVHYWANQSATAAAFTQLQALDNEKLYHPKTGLLNQNLGQEAGKAVDQTLSDYTAKASELNSSLANDQQKAMFGQLAREHINTVTRQAYTYEHEQYKRYDGENVAASVSQSQNTAVNTYTLPPDPGQGNPVDHQINIQTALIKDYGQRNGMPQPLIDLQVSKAKSATYTGVLDDMLANGTAPVAQAFFAAHKEEILPAEREKYSKALTIKSNRDDAVSIVQAQFLDPKTGVPKDPYQLANDLDNDTKLAANPELRQDAQQHASYLLEAYAKSQSAQNKGDYLAAFQSLKDANGDMSSMDPKALANLSEPQLRSLETYSDMKIKGKPVNPATSAQTRYHLEQLMDRNPAAFKDVDLVQPLAAGQLSPADFDKLSEQQRKPLTAAPVRDTPMINAAADAYLEHVGIDPKATFEKAPGVHMQVGDFRDKLNRELDDRMAANPKLVLSREDVNKAIATITQNVPEKTPGWFGSSVGAGIKQVPLYQHVNTLESTLPPGSRDQAYAAFRKAHGRDPSQTEYAQMLEQFSAMQNPVAPPAPSQYGSRPYVRQSGR